MHEVLRTLSEIGIVPVVALKDAADAVPLARALCAGGIPTAEVTFRTDAAAASIAAMRQEVPEMLVGAGTVLDTETCRTAILAGADFILSPTLNTEVIRMCNRYGRAAVPGVMTPTEILTALEAGADIVKVFPGGRAGGGLHQRRHGSAQAGVRHGRRRSEPGKHGGSVPRGRVLRGRGLQSGEQSADSKRQL